jgi:hypothetical protein
MFEEIETLTTLIIIIIILCIQVYKIIILYHTNMQKRVNKNNFKQGSAVHTYNPSYSGGKDRRIVCLYPSPSKDSETLSQKQNTNKRAGAWLKR